MRERETGTFRFRPDTYTLIVSIVSITILIIAFSVPLATGSSYSIIITAAILLLILIILSQSFVSVTIGKDYVKVNKIIGHKSIDNIKSIRTFSKKELSSCIRTFGNGGMCGYWGYYYSRNTGKFKIYAINLNQLVLITTEDGTKYVINYPYELLPKNDTQK